MTNARIGSVVLFPLVDVGAGFVIRIVSSGRCWMDALELALKCSSLLKRTMIREGKEDMSAVSTAGEHSINFYSLLRAHNIHGFQ